MPGPSYPSLGGQHAGYTANVLKLFKATPAGAPALKDPNYVIMAQIAGRLTDEEILALSSYLEGLHNRADAAPATAAQPTCGWTWPTTARWRWPRPRDRRPT